MKKILGLDLGTNSIGWALVENDLDNKIGKILGMNSRIIPMEQGVLSDFGRGITQSQTAGRTSKRGTRRLYQRDNLRRERLHRVLNVIGFLPEHYKKEIDFDFHKGQFINFSEPKIPYLKNDQNKYEFIFKESFNEMVEEFKIAQPELFYKKNNGQETKIPYDWTIYYLRKKALTQKISKQELAWLILNFNQKRGYYQLSEEEEIEDGKTKDYIVLKVDKVEDTGETIKKTGDKLYEVYFDNGWKYDKPITKINDWISKTKEFIVTSTITKNGDIKRTYKAVDSEQDWIAIKKKTEQEIGLSGKTVGVFIYETLLTNPTQKIRGKLVKTIERKFYKKEITEILEKQIELNNELQNKELYLACIEELYPNNEAHRKNIENKNFKYLFVDDIIFYQRPLKTKKHLISDCSLEYRIRRDTNEKTYLKCIAKSNPLFQEFRLWQFITNLKIYKRETDNEKEVDITFELLKSDEEIIDLFEWLNDREKINQKQLLNYFKKKEEQFRWNYVEDKDYPCNETRSLILNRLKKITINESFLTNYITNHLWHILYSVTDIDERKSAISKFAKNYNLDERFEEVFVKFPLFKKEYGAYSEKAIKKLLPLMRLGKYWNWETIDEKTKLRIDKIISGEFDSEIQTRVREKAIHLEKIEDFKKLPLWLASYIVYDRHSESSDTKKWTNSQDIADFLNPRMKGSFKQHSLRNPIVEQVLTETLRVVKDIWDEFGNGEEGFFDEIHIELGRDMKNDKKTRERISKKVIENENTNLRTRAVLNELLNEGIDVKPYSPSQQEILKIYEEGVYLSENKKEELEVIDKIRKNNSPSKSDIQRYKLWLNQGYISPYTGNLIMLSELFTHKYQIEHIFPQSRYFDDSLNNKIICETEVNVLKTNKTAYEFIKEFGGSKVNLTNNKSVTIFNLSEYEQHIKSYFAKNKIKKDNLLSEDIPESFINRQLNDSKYISKVVKNLLSKIVREEDEKEVTSKRVVTLPGSITSKMKQDWGLNDVWNDIISPRFHRMNELTNSNDFGEINPNTKNFLPKVPDSLLKGFDKKRIDHRHHALDALVIALVSKSHINYLNNLNAKDEGDKTVKYDLRNKLCFKSKPDDKGNYKWIFHKPWETFNQDTKAKLESTVVSFKQNTRVINKTKNKYLKWVNENGQLKKIIVPQEKGENWAIRRQLHQETVYGKISLQLKKEVSFNNGIKDWKNLVDKDLLTKIKKLVTQGKDEKEVIKYFKENPYLTNGEVTTSVRLYYYDENKSATRKNIDSSFNESNIESSITDTGIQKILLHHLKSEKYQNQIDEKGNNINPEILAFSPEGLEDLNKNIKQLNKGKNHKPIKSARVYEALGNKFNLGTNGNKKDKYVAAAAGTNLFFAIYYNEEKKKREFETIPLNVAIESLKQGQNPAPDYKNGSKLLFTLSPNDLVYIPTEDELENLNKIKFNNFTKEQVQQIYKMEKSTGIECYFIRQDVASLIKQYDAKTKIGEFSSQNKLETTIDGKTRIKDVCIKIKVNRLGNIKPIL